MQETLRLLPSLNALLERRPVKTLLKQWRRDVVLNLARRVLDDEREFLRRGKGWSSRYGTKEPDREVLLVHCEARLADRLEALRVPKLDRVLNATGVILHTNLGRARLAAHVADEVRRVAVDPCALEIDIAQNRRGSRNARVSEWLALLTGADAGVPVNNGAAALWLAVRALTTRGRKMIVSRGEQVAIGGSFRMPELMATTGAKVVEVGTTNKTSAKDYEQVVGEGDVVLKVHPSNYRIEGFHEEASLADLARVCRSHGAHLVFDAGSGSLYDYAQFGLSGEETVRESLEAGADLVTFSGDKLLGGPQAGLAVGRGELVQRMAKHPLMRALRLDKMALMALELTLATYAEAPGRAKPRLPLFDALDVSAAELHRRARALAGRLAPHAPDGWRITAARSQASIGGGSFAQHPVSSAMVELRARDAREADTFHRVLRRGRPAILARIDADRVELDLRAVRADELDELGAGVEAALRDPDVARPELLERGDRS